MQSIKIKNGIIALLLICATAFTTCEFVKPTNITEESGLQDTIFLSQWRREKTAKLNLISTYENKIALLQKDKDSLRELVEQKKQNVLSYRFKTKVLQEKLQDVIAKSDSVISKTELSPLTSTLINAQLQSDSLCDETIVILENVVANRDSSILFHKQVEDNLRDLQKEQELRNQYLTEQLAIAFKTQRKKTRQNKLLAGGILILSGITTSLLITQSLK